MHETERRVGRGLELPIVDRLNTRIDELTTMDGAGRLVIADGLVIVEPPDAG